MSSLKEIHARVGGKAVVDAVRAEYPKFDKQLLCKCESPEKYAIQLVPEAMELVCGLEAAPGKKKSDKRRKTRRYCFRLTEEQARKLDKLLKKLGYSTAQSLCEALIKQEVERNGL